ncbi:class I SAM-dependent methyltransferase [Rugosimonospora africana]|uniref:16S RNA G1207 methylase RsmC n=1 Tax=Rugosimonospora africana TaxID=556532 RepID=A0A8J3QIU6_9ACTN|nr:methyltransferase [Rugosimonospora africana]GIH11879.1 16S RNA G1207 methylase RsmC [Rugosimonospora africana]
MGSQYFDVEPTTPMQTRTVPLTVDGRQLELTSGSGVFGWQRIDLGTEILIRYAPRPPATGAILDLGCGYGPITVATALRAPDARIVSVDVNRRALELTRGNAARLGLGNVTAYEPDDVPADLSFAAIYSNPPIKVGKESLHDLLARWLPRMRPGARAYLVVKRSMGSDTLDDWLTASGWPAERLRSKSGYRILEVSAGPGGSGGED